jgi:phage-related protein
MGWSFWIVLALLFLCPSLLGVIVGRLFEGVYGIGTKAFRQVSAAIQNVKNESPTLVTALEASTDDDIKKFIKVFNDKNNIK